MTIRVIDFETTGLPPDASVCEAAFVEVDAEARRPGRQWHSLVQPTTAMALEALATHHITAAEAQANGIPWAEAERQLAAGADIIYCAHNAAFEQAFFNPPGSVWIDTYKVALRRWPEAPSHSNQVLRYYLELDVGAAAMPPHRALPDAWVTAHILLAALKDVAVADLIKWTRELPYLTRITFGKHRGARFADLPPDYLEWIVKQEMDAAVIAAARRELAK